VKVSAKLLQRMPMLQDTIGERQGMSAVSRLRPTGLGEQKIGITLEGTEYEDAKAE
jgi:hypothetical protein